MPAPTGPQPNEKLGEELDGLDEQISTLQVLYEKYFLGIDRRPPDNERKRVSSRMREVKTLNPRNTALRFRIQTMFAKLIAFERMWDRTLREIEDGTYKRDVYKAKMRLQKRELPPPPSKPSAPEISDTQLRKLYDTYLVARQRTGEATDGITYDSLAKRIRAQVPELLAKHKARNIEFKVVIKSGKAVLKAVPHTD